MHLSAYFERVMFKATPGGFAFQPPPPTAFHRTCAYFVNASQKAEILAIYTERTHPRARMAAAVALAIASGLWLYVVEAPSPLIVINVASVWFGAQILGFSFVLAQKQRELAPTLATLPRTDQRLFRVRRPSAS